MLQQCSENKNIEAETTARVFFQHCNPNAVVKPLMLINDRVVLANTPFLFLSCQPTPVPKPIRTSSDTQRHQLRDNAKMSDKTSHNWSVDQYWVFKSCRAPLPFLLIMTQHKLLIRVGNEEPARCKCHGPLVDTASPLKLLGTLDTLLSREGRIKQTIACKLGSAGAA